MWAGRSTFWVCSVRTSWDCESRCIGEIHSPPTRHIWLQPASSQFARFHFVFAIHNKSLRGDRYTKDGKFCRLRRNLPPAPTFPANFKQESFSWSRSQTQVGECKKAPRRRLFCLSPLAPPETGSRRVPQGFILSHLCGFFFLATRTAINTFRWQFHTEDDTLQ